MLSGRDGLSVLKALRAAGDATPVVLLTARGELSDRIVGLDLGDPTHRHEDPIEVRAEIVATTAIRGARVELSPALAKVLLVWYRPQQAWMEPGRPSPKVEFDR